MKNFFSQKIRNKLISKDKILLARLHPDQLDRFNSIKTNAMSWQEDIISHNNPENTTIHKTWADFASKITQECLANPHINFLSQPILRKTMVGQPLRLNVSPFLNFILDSLGPDLTRNLLQEDLVGCPLLIRPRTYNTSASRLVHLYQLCLSLTPFKRINSLPTSVIEWGGGYGDVACLFRRYMPNLTYHIIDIPQVLCLQKLYLDSIFGEDTALLCLDNPPVPGKINLISTEHVTKYRGLSCDLFISTWALSESNFTSQILVNNSRMFGAKACFIAYQPPSEIHPCSLIPAEIANIIFDHIERSPFPQLKDQFMLLAHSLA